jgi:aldehyde:ferredoxin oxidoreductase
MDYGVTGTILRVNLTTGKVGLEHPPDAFYRRYVGGRGLIAYYLLKELKAGIDPLAPENKLIFACGPVTGAPISGSGRNSVGAKSPLTGAYGEAEAGGFWGAALKHAGFDAIIVEGRAAQPVYLQIQEGEAALRDATHLWGVEIKQAQERIRQELDDASVKVAQIGPGGENLVRFASVVNDLNHVAGRCGLGAVMGSKQLKAIAVRGAGRMKVADPDQLRTLAPDAAEQHRD